MRRIPRRTSKDQPVYEAVTRGIVVRVVSEYQSNHSDPLEGRWFWAYTIEIENRGSETVQLISRRWLITDALNRTEEVAGPGVIGEQPRLKPQEAFRYTSGCPLTTASGEMRGAYQMLTDDGEVFDVEIPAFSLHLPEARRVVN
ncbi:Co2+/Mg2+ efflux protein ApaG [Phenylobacterium montanum]|uniref:Protein ApaG n=1 Tax=Phenylobacterium montanum TaxID=2823693 RepID=A0A975IU35_9CAUL|nr:Co2+/Mg2+ efflux protein ApaG [Caulobacter sp. S6]QUD87345.1 Co2+/Mg2+ efflux protein ApaG [Caulobacter sp. S6]